MELAEILVGFKYSMIINLPIDRIFQTFISAMIVDTYDSSVSIVLLPLRGFWQNDAPLIKIYNNIGTAFQYVF